MSCNFLVMFSSKVLVSLVEVTVDAFLYCDSHWSWPVILCPTRPSRTFLHLIALSPHAKHPQRATWHAWLVNNLYRFPSLLQSDLGAINSLKVVGRHRRQRFIAEADGCGWWMRVPLQAHHRQRGVRRHGGTLTWATTPVLESTAWTTYSKQINLGSCI